MNSRERFLAVLLIVLIGLGASGFAAYQFVYSPWKKHNENITKLREEIDDLDKKKFAIEQDQKKFETVTRKRSLPADITDARRDYAKFLEELLRKAGFPSPVVKAGEPNSTNVQKVSGNKPAYTKLDFVVDAEGDLISLVDFMHSFYRQPLLHQIQKIRVIKPTTSRTRGGGDLKVTFTIEALVLDRAENRSTLLATIPSVVAVAGGAAETAHDRRTVESGAGSPFMVLGAVARGMEKNPSDNRPLWQVSLEDYYRRIPGKNIFFGPAPVSKTRDDAVKDVDLGPFLCLTRISHTEGWDRAMIFDRYNKEEYEIEISPRGGPNGGVPSANCGVTVSKYWYLTSEENGRSVDVRKLQPNGAEAGSYDGRYLAFGNEERGNLRKYVVRRILESEILIEEYDYDRVRMMRGPAPLAIGGMANLALPGKIYRWQIGNLLKPRDESMKGLTTFDVSRKAREALLRPLEIEGDMVISDESEAKESKSPKNKGR
jgi:hypothetical protein